MKKPRWEFWALLAVIALAAIVRIALIGRSGLWADEVFSLAMATGHSVEHPAALADPARGDFVEPAGAVHAREFLRYVEHETPLESPARVVRAVTLSDTSPPLYYLLLYGWTIVFGTSDAALRMFSVVCSLACLPLIAGVARFVGGRRAMLPAAALFAFAPFSIYYATEGRMYALLWLWVLAGAWLTLALRVRGARPALVAGWIAVSAAGFLTHYFFFFPWTAMLAVFAVSPGRFRRVFAAAAIAVVVLAVLPWYLHLPEIFRAPRITGNWLKVEPNNFHRWPSFRDLVLGFFSGRTTELWFDRVKANTAALVLCVGVTLAMVARLRARAFTHRRLLPWLWFAAACLGPLVLDFAQHTYLIAKPRYAASALPAACLLIAAGLALFGPRIRAAALVLLVVAWIPPLTSIFRNPLRSWSPMRQIARATAETAGPRDLILVHSIPTGLIGVVRYAETDAPIASWIGQLGGRRVPESIEQLVAGRARVFFVRIHNVGEPAPEESWLREHATLVRELDLVNSKLEVFHPKDGTGF